MSSRRQKSKQRTARHRAQVRHEQTELVQVPIVRAGLPMLRDGLLRARYDAAQTTDENSRHWANADALSASAANTLAVRQTLRNRARYEAYNNCYLNGMVRTLSNDTVGIGPRLQILTPDRGVNREAEALWREWAMEIRLAAKLRVMSTAKIIDGEVFAVMATNRRLDGPIKLDLHLVECDRVTSPAYGASDDVDGIRFDAFGNPLEYCLLRNHPGDLARDMAFAWIPFEYMIHWFRGMRPGQQRGVSELMPALPLSALLRRYTLAVVAAAETAADFAAVLQTDAPADDNPDAKSARPWTVIELEQRMATVLPEGWKLGQVQSQQPTTTYAEFKRELINEMARAFLEPRNVAAGDSSDYNYASGRLDHQTYFRVVEIEQMDIESVVLDAVLRMWIREVAAAKIIAWPRSAYRWADTLRVPHHWLWKGTQHVDPLKEAKAQETRLKNHTATHTDEWGRDGEDVEEKFELIAQEKKLMKDLEAKYGISFDETPKTVGTNDENNVDDDEEK